MDANIPSSWVFPRMTFFIKACKMNSFDHRCGSRIGHNGPKQHQTGLMANGEEANPTKEQYHHGIPGVLSPQDSYSKSYGGNLSSSQPDHSNIYEVGGNAQIVPALPCPQQNKPVKSWRKLEKLTLDVQIIKTTATYAMYISTCEITLHSHISENRVQICIDQKLAKNSKPPHLTLAWSKISRLLMEAPEKVTWQP